MVNAFPAHIRTASVGIAYNAAQAIFGGTAPVINSGLAMGNPALPCLWSILVGTLSSYSLYAFEKRKDTLQSVESASAIDNVGAVPAIVTAVVSEPASSGAV